MVSWVSEIPSEKYIFENVEGPEQSAPDSMSAVIFGGTNSHDPSQLVGIIGYALKYVITGLQFVYADPSKNECLGKVDGVSEDFQYRYSIDGPSGEMITGVEQLRATEPSVKLCVSSRQFLPFPGLEPEYPDRERLRTLKVAYPPSQT